MMRILADNDKAPDSKYAIDHLGNGSVDIFVGTSSDEIFLNILNTGIANVG
jgi:hypothetical protein